MLGIELLQIALGLRTDLSHTPSSEEWSEIYQFAQDQAMLGVLFAGVEKLPEHQMPDVDLMMDWLGQAEYQKSLVCDYETALSEFATMLEDENISFVVFKGLAAASKYPDPSIRSVGDVDFYVPACDFQRCLGLIESRLGVDVNTNDVDKHYSFTWNDIGFEMHYQVETFGHSAHQAYFNQMVDKSIQVGCSEFVTGGVRVPMLNPVEDLIVVMKHWMNHFIGEGVGLRQTADLAVLVGEYRDQIDISVLKQNLKGIGYLRVMDAVVAMVERYIGVKWDEYWKDGESVRESSCRWADRMMADVMKNGNFGRSDYRFKTGWKKRMETTWRFFYHCVKYYRLAPKDIRNLVPKRILISLRAH